MAKKRGSSFPSNKQLRDALDERIVNIRELEHRLSMQRGTIESLQRSLSNEAKIARDRIGHLERVVEGIPDREREAYENGRESQLSEIFGLLTKAGDSIHEALVVAETGSPAWLARTGAAEAIASLSRSVRKFNAVEQEKRRRYRAERDRSERERDAFRAGLADGKVLGKAEARNENKNENAEPARPGVVFFKFDPPAPPTRLDPGAAPDPVHFTIHRNGERKS